MKALKKFVVVGAMGGLATATAAASGAFACTAVDSVSVFAVNGDTKLSTVEAGQPVTIALKLVDRGSTAGDTVVLTWQTPDRTADGRVLETPMATHDPSTSGTFEKSFVVPADAIPYKRTTHSYNVVAIQYNAYGQPTKFSASAEVFVKPAPGGTFFEDRPVSEQVRVQNEVAKTETVASSPTASATRTATAPAAPSVLNVPAVDAATSAAQPATASATRTATQPATVGTPEQPIILGPLVAGEKAPVVSDLWSGLSADRTPTLLDAGAPRQQTSSSPLGVVLLGGGAIALAGVAVAATRRRFAHAG